MKNKKTLLLLSFLLLSYSLYAGDFTRDWLNYKLSDNWKVKTEKSVKFMPFAGKNKVGSLEFRYDTDSAKHTVKYLVFEYPAKDTVLVKKLNDYALRQLKLQEIDISKPFLKNFVLNGFYYFLFPRPDFALEDYRECQQLAKLLFEY
jgi:hypothetical protein